MARTRNPLPLPEFILLSAMIMASIAFGTDSMLPALGEIAEELSPEAPNRAQLIVVSFILGVGIGTFFTGPLADRFGRRPVIVGGFLIYMGCSILAYVAPTLELVLVARLLQGIGGAGPRVACVAMIRDLFQGRRMAEVMSFVMMVFTIVPAIAPLMGAGIIAVTGWRGIFLAYVVWSAAIALWILLRQPETLAPENRRTLALGDLLRGTVEILRIRDVVLAIAVLSMCFGIVFSALSVVQPIFEETFGRAAHFPWYFAAISLVAASGSLLNARLVGRVGMRAMVRRTLWAELGISVVVTLAVLSGALPPTVDFILFLIWLQSLFIVAGLTIGNLNSLAMEPVGHMAGLAASIVSAIATIGSILVAVPVGQMFDGTPLSLALGVTGCCLVGLVLMRFLKPEADATPAIPIP